MRFALPRLTSLVASVVALSCSPSDGASCVDYTPPASFNAQAPAVTFSRDVFPLFRQSCAFTTCHGSTSGTSNGVYLGSTEASKVRANLVGVASTTLPSMSLVTAGEPRQSFLMRKLDGSQCALDASCASGSCGQSMPRGDSVLPLETRDAVRRWIAQGAKDD